MEPIGLNLSIRNPMRRCQARAQNNLCQSFVAYRLNRTQKRTYHKQKLNSHKTTLLWGLAGLTPF